MTNKYLYARQKLRETIYSLATGPGDIRKRLNQVYIGFFNLKRTDFPEELQLDWEWIQKELKKFGPIIRDDGSVFRGAVENTCIKIKNKTGVKIAEKILKIYLNLESD
ncbi:MAG TPA: hypothetical protein DCR40_00930 [Prolixibacteraceae bacterium]|nr:hypothetical protein [Prolixibacteraceae bacterium]